MTPEELAQFRAEGPIEAHRRSRLCHNGCGRPVPRRDANFCSAQCRQQWHGRRRAERARLGQQLEESGHE